MSGTVFRRRTVRRISLAAAVSTTSLAFALAAGFSAVPTSLSAPPTAVYTPPTPIVPPTPIAPRLLGQTI